MQKLHCAVLMSHECSKVYNYRADSRRGIYVISRVSNFLPVLGVTWKFQSNASVLLARCFQMERSKVIFWNEARDIVGMAVIPFDLLIGRWVPSVRKNRSIRWPNSSAQILSARVQITRSRMRDYNWCPRLAIHYATDLESSYRFRLKTPLFKRLQSL